MGGTRVIDTLPRFFQDPRRACADVDPDVFFAYGARQAAAKVICRRCRFRVPCAEYAIDADERAGVWGALTVDERDAARRRREAGR